MDLTQSIVPNSAQVNAEDLLASARTVTITQVEAGSAEQPVFVHLEEFPGRTYRPSKSMRRILVAAWGADAANYVGRRLTIFRNPEVSFGREKVGGIQISHLSNIDKPLTVALTVSRGKRAPFTVQPLEDAPATVDRVTEFVGAFGQAGSLDQLKALWQAASSAGLGSDARVVAAKDAAKVRLSDG